MTGSKTLIKVKTSLVEGYVVIAADINTDFSTHDVAMLWVTTSEA